MKRVLSVIGARPQFVKAAVVSPALAAAGLDEYMVHTGQHYDRQMSEVFFEELGLRPPDLNLNVGSGSHASQTGAMLLGLERAISERQPDCVLVYGDTNSTLAGALAAAKLHVPVAHVEAGLRSFNRRMPEEINRVVADTLGTILFTPTETARRNLEREGVPYENIVPTGDVMYDVVLAFRERAAAAPGILDRLKINGASPYVLVTIHRAENTDDPERLRAIFAGLAKVAKHLRVILPLHPRTRSRLVSLLDAPLKGIEVIEPTGFLDMLRLEERAQVIATDSGGVQKEAFFHQVPCVTLRDETEWVELVELGWNRLVPARDPEQIANAILAARGIAGRPATPYGNGTASERIAETLRG